MFSSSKGKGVAMTEDEHNELVAEIQGLYSPPLQEPEFDEIERLTSRIAELEAKLAAAIQQLREYNHR
jgi:hypothetical protein